MGKRLDAAISTASSFITCAMVASLKGREAKTAHIQTYCTTHVAYIGYRIWRDHPIVGRAGDIHPAPAVSTTSCGPRYGRG